MEISGYVKIVCILLVLILPMIVSLVQSKNVEDVILIIQCAHTVKSMVLEWIKTRLALNAFKINAWFVLKIF